MSSLHLRNKTCCSPSLKNKSANEKDALGRYTENHTVEYDSSMYFGFQEVGVAAYPIILYINITDFKINDR
jgi:hypothetical protein